jgi:hypothetical protein
VEKYGRTRQATGENIIQRIRGGRINILVILAIIVFLRQQCLLHTVKALQPALVILASHTDNGSRITNNVRCVTFQKNEYLITPRRKFKISRTQTKCGEIYAFLISVFLY